MPFLSKYITGRSKSQLAARAGGSVAAYSPFIIYRTRRDYFHCDVWNRLARSHTHSYRPRPCVRLCRSPRRLARSHRDAAIVIRFRAATPHDCDWYVMRPAILAAQVSTSTRGRGEWAANSQHSFCTTQIGANAVHSGALSTTSWRVRCRHTRTK